jgi:hypothetical protein
MNSVFLAFGMTGLLINGISAHAETIVWGNNASATGTESIEAFDIDTGAQIASFLVPNPGSNLNGRGIAVVGTTIYYSNAFQGQVYLTNTVTHTADGIAFNTGLNGIANIAWDGTALWVTGYNGTNNAYRYSPAGVLLQTVLGFGNSRDGFEVANNHLIANRGDGEHIYDLYDLNGVLQTSAFINTESAPGFVAGSITTGITFDGTDYIIANSPGFNGPTSQLLIYDVNGNYLRTQTLTGTPPGGAPRLLEDLSSLGNIPTNPPPGAPEPASIVLLGVGLAGLTIPRVRKMLAA